MLRFIHFVWNLFTTLPWWGAVGVIAGLAVSLVLFAKYIVHRLIRDSIQAIAEQGIAMTDAVASVHSAEPAPPPAQRSPLDCDPNDEDYDPEFDDDFLDESACHVSIDVTIAPQDPDATWDPSALALVSAEFVPEEDLEVCEQTAVLHSLEVWSNGAFHPWNGADVIGPQRLRLLFAAPRELRHAKFMYHFTYFGRMALPQAVTAGVR